MSAIIYRGSTCRIRFKPTNGMHVSELGTPMISIYQEGYLISPEVHVDSGTNTIYADLTEEDTIMLADGIPASAQAIYQLPNGNVYRFVPHTLNIVKTDTWILSDEEEE